jgi:hypothetical protein
VIAGADCIARLMTHNMHRVPPKRAIHTKQNNIQFVIFSPSLRGAYLRNKQSIAHGVPASCVFTQQNSGKLEKGERHCISAVAPA